MHAGKSVCVCVCVCVHAPVRCMVLDVRVIAWFSAVIMMLSIVVCSSFCCRCWCRLVGINGIAKEDAAMTVAQSWQ
jgi:hypothetical protein